MYLIRVCTVRAENSLEVLRVGWHWRGLETATLKSVHRLPLGKVALLLLLLAPGMLAPVPVYH